MGKHFIEKYLVFCTSWEFYYVWLQEWYRELVAEPELIVEQLIMCTRLSTLESLLSSLKDCLAELPPGSSLSSPCLDALLRRYASKALDIHVRTTSLPIKKHQIAVCQVMSREKFSPPEIPPTKEEWVPNDEASTFCFFRIIENHYLHIKII